MNQNSVNERINLTFSDHKDNNIELPFKILAVCNLTDDARSEEVNENGLIKVEGDINSLLAAQNVSISIKLENILNPASSEAIDFEYQVSCLEDFTPENILSGVESLSLAYQLHNQLGDDSIKSIRLQEPLLEFGFNTGELLDFNERLMIQAELQQRMNEQLDLIIQNDRFRALESSWLSLNYLHEHINYKENIELIILNSSKKAVLEDFEDSPDVTQSTLFQLVYSAEFGQFGGRPYSLMIGDFEFSQSAMDISLLQSLASLSAVSHCPLLSSASANLFGIDNYADLSRIRDISSHFDQPMYAKWNSFRQSEDSKYVSLVLPKFLLRSSYSATGQGFSYREKTSKKTSGLWGNAAFALATRFANSYAHFRWYINVSGSEFGLLDDLNVNSSSSIMRTSIPTEIMISDRNANELTKNGFTPLVIHKASKKAGFTSIPSCRQLPSFPETLDGLQSSLNQKLESQLPFMLITCRFSHYIKVMQRENIGSWQTRNQIEQSLNKWLKQFVSDMDNPAPAVRARRPLRDARINVRDMEGKSGWFLSTISITPHFKYMGQSFTLSERGRLEKA